jgi:hypothetical protein
VIRNDQWFWQHGTSGVILVSTSDGKYLAMLCADKCGRSLFFAGASGIG